MRHARVAFTDGGSVRGIGLKAVALGSPWSYGPSMR